MMLNTMKKTVLGKITFILTCVFTMVYIFTKVYAAWSFGVSFEGWKNVIDLLNSTGGYGPVRIISEYFVVPIICAIVCLIYLIEIGRNKVINRVVIAVTALALSVEMLFYILGNMNRYYHSVPFWPLLFRIGFLLAFILLFARGTKQILHKILYAVLGCSFVGIAIYLVIGYKNNLAIMIKNLEQLQGVDYIWGYLEYFTIPILELVVCGLVLCYILFPKKFYKI